MDWTAITVAFIGTTGVVIAAKFGAEPLLRARREGNGYLSYIAAEFQPNGGTSGRDQWNRTERSVQTLQQMVADLHHATSRNAELMQDHLEESAANRLAAHQEAIEMWKAIKAVHEAPPPKEGNA